jgi:hypothetical protein
VGVREVVKDRISSSNFNPKKAYLKSKEVNIALPCKNYRVAVSFSVTFTGNFRRGFVGEISTINPPKQLGFALRIKYELTPNR